MPEQEKPVCAERDRLYGVWIDALSHQANAILETDARNGTVPLSELERMLAEIARMRDQVENFWGELQEHRLSHGC